MARGRRGGTHPSSPAGAHHAPPLLCALGWPARAAQPPLPSCPIPQPTTIHLAQEGVGPQAGVGLPRAVECAERHGVCGRLLLVGGEHRAQVRQVPENLRGLEEEEGWVGGPS